jgi:ribokinase
MALDFLAIGDIVNDEFITLDPHEATVLEEGGERLIAMRFGDKLPYRNAELVPAVGNSPNAAVAAHRLGLVSALMTDIGDDEEGVIALAQLEREGVDTRFVRRHKGKTTNHHYVLRLGAERTILIKHAAYPYAFPDLPEEPRWIYLSSVGKEGSLPYQKAIAAYVQTHPSVCLAFQPGSFQIRLGYETLKEVYQASMLFFCNREEAMVILNTTDRSIRPLLEGIHSLGPRIVVITDGPEGAYAFDGETAWFMPPYPDPAPPVDRTGAGDSFAATFTCALALGKSIPEALQWAPINSASVVQHIGAQKGLLSRSALESWLAKAPEGYLPQTLSS